MLPPVLQKIIRVFRWPFLIIRFRRQKPSLGSGYLDLEPFFDQEHSPVPPVPEEIAPRANDQVDKRVQVDRRVIAQIAHRLSLCSDRDAIDELWTDTITEVSFFRLNGVTQEAVHNLFKEAAQNLPEP